MTTASQPYREWLRSRWPSRASALAWFATGGSFSLLLFDLAFTRALPAPPPVWTVVAARLSWIGIAGVALALGRLRPPPPWFPSAIIALSVAWAWGNAATYLAIGLGGTPMQSVGHVLFVLGAAMFLPLTFRERLAFFALMWGGCSALDLLWPGRRPPSERLWTNGAWALAVIALGFVFERFALAQRRGLVLRRRLERLVHAIEKSRARAAAAASEVTQLAADVAHDVNNPLAVAKASLQMLRDPPSESEPPGERSEIAAEALEAVDRIAVIVAAQSRKGVG
ncbi:MAG TPA: histidine kinase dimerization/phospho-acceptor domain-containing protein, partial [Anaeromyxobacteraceae bacterium]|nr:histidine kinase dimerization/phospho-acceptor domain-containing protein [Anaeromyxobacteraceae bacterium]